ncbi:GD21789 [Drosophila simulans]|uniref:GD21789 n=1 Tax=Drosophila simulans TaxID=7240 RepID=B4Q9E3_DROSI|nr:GD21789 [Drosophila simulans]
MPQWQRKQHRTGQDSQNEETRDTVRCGAVGGLVCWFGGGWGRQFVKWRRGKGHEAEQELVAEGHDTTCSCRCVG